MLDFANDKSQWNYWNKKGWVQSSIIEELANAIAKLPIQRQKIILMSFFIGLNDREIGEIIGKSIGSVWYQRQTALKDLEKYLGGNYEEK